MLAPMLAKIGSISDLKRAGWIYEPKLDGTRGILIKQGSKARILNRRKKWIEWRYPEIIKDAKKIKESFVLDGEICVLDSKGRPDFNLIQSREQTDNKLKIKLLSKELPAIYYVFDILSLDSKDLTNKPLRERKKILEKVLPDLEHIKRIFWTKDGPALWKVVRRKKLEGVMAKKLSSKYYAGKRSSAWLKIKFLKTIDSIIIGYTQEKRIISALALGVYSQGKLIYIGRVGTGFSEAFLKDLYKKLRQIKSKKAPAPYSGKEKIIWVRPKYVCEVKYLEISKKKILRAPVFLRLRKDKLPKECILEEQIS